MFRKIWDFWLWVSVEGPKILGEVVGEAETRRVDARTGYLENRNSVDPKEVRVILLGKEKLHVSDCAREMIIYMYKA